MATQKKLTATLLKCAGANAFGQGVSILTQIVQVPLLLHRYGVQLTGEWILLSALPAYILLSDIGLSNVAANEMSAAVSRGDEARARQLCQSLCRFIGAISLCLFGLVVFASTALDWKRYLNLKVLGTPEIHAIVMTLSLGAVFYLSSGLFYSVYRACNLGARIFFLVNLTRLGDFIVLVSTVACHVPLGWVGVALLAFRCVAFFLIWWDCRVHCALLPLGFRNGRWPDVREMLRPAIAFLAFPVGNALYNQGTILVVNATMGAPAVVVYNAYRVFSRVAPMLLLIGRSALWVEYPHLVAKHELEKVRILQRVSTGLTWCVIALAFAVVCPFGVRIINYWTLGRVTVTIGVVILFYCVASVNGFWNTGATLLFAVNQHEGLARRYILCMIFGLLAAYLSARAWGIAGIGFSLVVAEAPLCFYVVPKACAIAGDHIGDFIADIATLRSLRRYAKKYFGHAATLAALK